MYLLGEISPAGWCVFTRACFHVAPNGRPALLRAEEACLPATPVDTIHIIVGVRVMPARKDPSQTEQFEFSKAEDVCYRPARWQHILFVKQVSKPKASFSLAGTPPSLGSLIKYHYFSFSASSFNPSLLNNKYSAKKYCKLVSAAPDPVLCVRAQPCPQRTTTLAAAIEMKQTALKPPDQKP